MFTAPGDDVTVIVFSAVDTSLSNLDWLFEESGVHAFMVRNVTPVFSSRYKQICTA